MESIHSSGIQDRLMLFDITWMPTLHLAHSEGVLRLARQLLCRQHALDAAIEADKYAIVGSSGHISVCATAR